MTSLKNQKLRTKQRNYSRHLFNAVRIGHTKRFMKIMKMQFYVKLNENEFKIVYFIYLLNIKTTV